MEPQALDNSGVKRPLNNATAVLVLGILSIALCWCYGIIGLTLGIIALVLASKAKKQYAESPSSYTEGSYKNMNAGRICAIIGTSLSGAYIIYFLCILAFFGAALSSFPWQSLMNK